MPPSATSTLTGARLYPTFVGATTSYTASVGYTVAQTTVTATTNGSNATLRTVGRTLSDVTLTSRYPR